MTQQSNRAIQDKLKDPDCSPWLKGALVSALRRDPNEAARDAEMLAKLLNARSGDMLFAQRSY